MRQSKVLMLLRTFITERLTASVPGKPPKKIKSIHRRADHKSGSNLKA